MILAGKAVKGVKVAILGLTFKENCPDIRNSKVEDIILRLREFQVELAVVDPWADEKEAMKEYGVSLTRLEKINNVDCVILAVAHREFRELDLEDFDKMYKTDLDNKEKVLIDVKGILNTQKVKERKYQYWRL